MTAKPSRVRRSATYRPMPPDAPVTRATLACTSVIDVLPLGTGLSAASRASTLVFGRPPGAGGRHRTNLSARTRQTDEGNFYRGDVVEWAGSSLWRNSCQRDRKGEVWITIRNHSGRSCWGG